MKTNEAVIGTCKCGKGLVAYEECAKCHSFFTPKLTWQHVLQNKLHKLDKETKEMVLKFVESLMEIENKKSKKQILQEMLEKMQSEIPEEKYTGFGAWSPKGMHLDDHKRIWGKKQVEDIKSIASEHGIEL